MFFLVLLIGWVSATAQKPLYTWPLGVEGYTYRNSWPRGVAQTLDTIKMLGFTELEGGARMDPHAFRKLCDERGSGFRRSVRTTISCCSIRIRSSIRRR